jgi:small subunit ribosomal protein S20
MPVTKTAKRALRGSKNKAEINKLLIKKLEIAIRVAKKTKNGEKILKAISLVDRTAKKRIIHKNKAARMKSQLSKLISSKVAVKVAKTASKKVSPSKK